MKTTLIVLLLGFTTGLALAAGSSTHYILNTKRLSTSEIALTCLNGADPTGTKIGDTVIISCGK
jgi:hypothetical protein